MKRILISFVTTGILSLTGQASDRSTFLPDSNLLGPDFFDQQQKEIDEEFATLIEEEGFYKKIAYRNGYTPEEQERQEAELILQANKEIEILKTIFGDDEYQKLYQGSQKNLVLGAEHFYDIKDCSYEQKTLQNFLRETKTLTSLDLSCISLDPSRGSLAKLGLSVKDVLESNPSITSFDLDGNNIQDQDLLNIKHQGSIEYLNLRNNNISGLGITNFLRNNKSIKGLNLLNNNIDSQALKKIIDDHKLTTLDVRYNDKIDIQGIRHTILYNNTLIEFLVTCTEKQQKAINSFTTANEDRHGFFFHNFINYFDSTINYLETFANLETSEITDKIIEETPNTSSNTAEEISSDSDEDTSSDTDDDSDMKKNKKLEISGIKDKIIEETPNTPSDTDDNSDIDIIKNTNNTKKRKKSFSSDQLKIKRKKIN